MPPTPSEIAHLCTKWATEVCERVHAPADGSAVGELLTSFARRRAGRELLDELAVLLHIVIEESAATHFADPCGPTQIPDRSPDREIARGLKWLIAHTQTVAAPYELQRMRLPETFISRADDIAEDFAAQLWFQRFGIWRGLLMQRQLEALARLDDWVGSFGGQANAEHWSDAALQSSPKWTEARRLATQALQRFCILPPGDAPLP